MIALDRTFSEEEYNALVSLYESSFPIEERRAVLLRDKLHVIRAAGGEVCGFMTLWPFDGFTYIEHFAVFPEMRGRGVGSEALGLIVGNVALEVERPEGGEECVRRMAFYRRHGFEIADREYVQPSYSGPGGPTVPMYIMSRGQLGAVRDILHRVVYGVIS